MAKKQLNNKTIPFKWVLDTHGLMMRELRLAREMTQAQLAKKINTTQASVSNWEKGKAKPSSTQISKLDSLFGTKQLRGDTAIEIKTESGLLADWVRETREMMRWSRQQLAKEAEISYLTVLNIEMGRSVNPQTRTIEAIQQALNTELPEELGQELFSEAEFSVEGVGPFTDFDPYDFLALPRVAGIYVFYDISDRAVYVGKGDVIRTRVLDHEQKFWFKRPIVDKASFVQVDDEKLRSQIEAVMIKFMKSNAVINKQLVQR